MNEGYNDNREKYKKGDVYMKKEQLQVVFRKFSNGEVIALFPQLTDKYRYRITTYMHIGQHSEDDHHAVVQQTKLATEEEYAPLLTEIEQIYHEYDLRVMKKLNVKWN